MNKPDINWDDLWRAMNRDDHDDDTGKGTAYAIVTQLRDDAYEAGRRDVMTEGPARAAMLEGAAYWLDAAETSNGETGRIVARVVAQAFTERAEKLLPSPRPTLDPAFGLCGSSEAHGQHRFEEDYQDGKLISWRTCQGVDTSS